MKVKPYSSNRSNSRSGRNRSLWEVRALAGMAKLKGVLVEREGGEDGDESRLSTCVPGVHTALRKWEQTEALRGTFRVAEGKEQVKIKTSLVIAFAGPTQDLKMD
jgi:hypothetical protein